MMSRRGALAGLLLLGGVCGVLPSGLAAQAVATGDSLSLCASAVPDECGVELYGPNANPFSRYDEARELIDDRTVTGGETCPAIVGAAFADWMIEGEPQPANHAGDSIPYHVGAHITGVGPDLVFIASSVAGEEMLTTILHEAAHHEGEDDHELAEYAARNCLQDDDDDDNPGGGSMTCTDETYTYTEWEPVYAEIEAGSCIGIGSLGIPFPQGNFGEQGMGEDDDPYCTPAVWGWVYEEVERTGTRTVCVTN